MIKIKNLKKSYGTNLVLKNVNLEINKGEIVAIIGYSGCGKSTLLRCINAIETYDEGEILYHGKNIKDKDVNIDELRSKIAMVYQNFNLFTHLNVLENLILAPIKVKKMSKKDAIEKAKGLLKMVGMDNRMFHMPNQLSGGQMQRVAIARCLMMDPEMILFDEPTSALDPSMIDEVEGVIKKCVDRGVTCIIVTQEMRFAKSIANKVVYMDDFSIYEVGTPEQIFDNPEKLKTRHFIEKSKKFEIEIDKNNLDIYEFNSEVKRYCIYYEASKKIANSAFLIYEEIVYNLINKLPGEKILYSLSLEDNNKEITLVFDKYNSNILEDDNDMLDFMQKNMISSVYDNVKYEVNDKGKSMLIFELIK